MHFSCLPYVPHAPPVLFLLISPPIQYLVRITRYEVPSCSIVFQSPVTLSLSSSPLLPCLSQAFLSIYRISSACVPCSVWETRFIPILNNWQYYRYVYFNLYVLWKRTGRQKILDRMKADIPRVLSAPNFSTEAILICWTVPNYLNFATLGLITYLYVVILSCLLFKRHDLNT